MSGKIENFGAFDKNAELQMCRTPEGMRYLYVDGCEIIVMERTAKMLKKALKSIEPDSAEKYKPTIELCDGF